MAEFVRAYTGDEGNTLVSVSAELAESLGLHTVKDAAVDERGNPLPPSEGYRKTSAKKAASTTSGGASAASTPEEASK
jgi:hypothetical protein